MLLAGLDAGSQMSMCPCVPVSPDPCQHSLHMSRLYLWPACRAGRQEGPVGARTPVTFSPGPDVLGSRASTTPWLGLGHHIQDIDQAQKDKPCPSP